MNSNIPFFYKCKSCGQRGQTNDGREACAKFKIVINPEEDFCSWHTTKDSSKCTFCGSADNLILYDIGNDDHLIVCSKCYPALFSCQTCSNAQDCSFAADRSEAQYVMKTVRQGFTTMQTQIRNPNLVSKHCSICHCGLATTSPGDFICQKDNNEGCKNWQLHPKFAQL